MFEWLINIFSSDEEKQKEVKVPEELQRPSTVEPRIPVITPGVLIPTIPIASVPMKPSGYDIMKSFLGKHEVSHKKELMAFFKKHAKNGDIYHDPSTTAWCAMMVNACERAVGNPGTPPLSKGWYSTQARSFTNYGVEIAAENAKPGDIPVFSRGGSTRQGHVGYFVNFKTINGVRMVTVLGGNQGNKVCYDEYPVSRLLGIRRYSK